MADAVDRAGAGRAGNQEAVEAVDDLDAAGREQVGDLVQRVDARRVTGGLAHQLGRGAGADLDGGKCDKSCISTGIHTVSQSVLNNL
jgi:hypothetical protein